MPSKLGFAVSDRVRNEKGAVTTCFLRCNHEHHTVAIFLKSEAGLDHHSYEAGEWTTIKDWADHLGGMRIPIVWGPGRHGPRQQPLHLHQGHRRQYDRDFCRA